MAQALCELLPFGPVEEKHIEIITWKIHSLRSLYIRLNRHESSIS